MQTLTEDNIDIININEFYRHVRFTSLEGGEIEWTDEQAHELKEQIINNQNDSKIYRELYFDQRKNFEIVERLKNPDDFVEWQKKCVCDFENNNNTHSLTCKSRWQKILDGKIG